MAYNFRRIVKILGATRFTQALNRMSEEVAAHKPPTPLKPGQTILDGTLLLQHACFDWMEGDITPQAGIHK